MLWPVSDLKSGNLLNPVTELLDIALPKGTNVLGHPYQRATAERVIL